MNVQAKIKKLEADPALAAKNLVARTPGMADLIWKIDCAIHNAAQAYRDANPGAFDWQNQADRDKAIRLVAQAALGSALVTDRYN